MVIESVEGDGIDDDHRHQGYNIRIDGAIGGRISMSYFDTHDSTTVRVTLPSSTKPRVYWELGVSGRMPTGMIWAVTYTFHTVPTWNFEWILPKHLVLQWFTSSVGEADGGILWKMSVKGVTLDTEESWTVEDEYRAYR
ncbi:hypothetical protein RAM80_03865 [Pseudomonas sp. App30]|uniref:hypothetical protein n=1 Tax=Pseudomonas sp. App30 TaxID=3068990 RepID=UPI003A7F9D14